MGITTNSAHVVCVETCAPDVTNVPTAYLMVFFWDILVRELRNPLKNWATRNCRFQPWVIEFTWRQRVSFRGTVVVRDKLRPSIRIQGAMPNQMRQNFVQYRKKKMFHEELFELVPSFLLFFFIPGHQMPRHPFSFSSGKIGDDRSRSHPS